MNEGCLPTSRHTPPSTHIGATTAATRLLAACAESDRKSFDSRVETAVAGTISAQT